MRIGAGIIPADHGAVHYAEKTYLRARLHKLAQEGLFYLPQGGFFTPDLTLGQHLDALRRCVGCSPSTEILDLLEIRDLLHVKTRAYSGGERRRTEIAVAVMRQPRCLLADEPFGGISPSTAEVIAAALRELAADGCAVIITGHEVPQMLQIADEVVWATAGTTRHVGSPAEAVHHEQFRREYLGPRAGVPHQPRVESERPVA